MILAGDIGGTKTLLALFEETDGGLRTLRSATFASREYESLEKILAAFLATRSGFAHIACFAAAGPVIDGRCQTTELGWMLDEGALCSTLGGVPVKLLNDVQAAGFGVPYLQPDELGILNPGERRQRRGNIAVIAAGTGLGEAILHWDGVRYHPVASEGGHADFAPRTDQEIELLRYLRIKYDDHVSYERLLSGPGIQNIYAFLRDTGYAHESPVVSQRLASGDLSATIAQFGLVGSDALCVATLDLFSSIYGAEAGNLALKCLAFGGVFLAGGIAPKLLPALKKGAFLRAFVEKGRFAELMRAIEVSVVLSQQLTLVGAANFALQARKSASERENRDVVKLLS
jgi:glucokinase